ncbi:P-loop containing nucleoside triphosphate hydrolase protein, partial [Chytriomyces sp. MP71]
VTGSIRAGRMTAIMGPSGSGKTTFMSVLMGKVARTAGTLKISGTLAEMKDFKKLIGYVPQEDIMIEELTVRENIRYAARTKLPNSWTNMEVDDHVDSILKALNLTHVAHKRIGGTLVRGISGGQRKRVNIGMELAAAPLSVFLDEPTSGLDSTSALDVANILLSVSRLGLTIVSVIHQPRVEIFEIFDDILMIAPGGITAYIGPTTGVQAYFESLGFIFKSHSNVADTLMDILAGRGEVRNGISESITRPSEIVAKWRERDANNVASMEVETPPVYAATAIESMRQVAKLRGASFIRQFGLSHNRSLLQQSRLFTAFIIEAFVGFLCGLIMGIASGGGEALTGMFIQPYTALGASPKYWFVGLYGLLVGLSISLAATPSGVKVFGEEKAVYLREAEAGHNIHAYYLGKNLASIYRVILSAGHFCGIYYLLAQPPIDIGIQFAIIFLNFVGTYGVGMMVSMVVKRENAPLLGVTIALIWEVLCGFGPSITDATDGGYIFLYDIGVNRWMAETQFTLWVEAYNIYDKTIAANVFGYQFGNTARNIGLMVVVCIGYRIITYLLFLANIYSGSLKIWISKITSARRASPQASSKRVEQEAFHADVEEESATVDSEK